MRMLLRDIMFDVYLSRRALENLKNIKGKPLRRIENLLLKLKKKPLPAKEFDIRKVRNVSDTYRVRISQYRIIYRIRRDVGEIFVVKIVRRDEKKGHGHDLRGNPNWIHVVGWVMGKSSRNAADIHQEYIIVALLRGFCLI